MKLLSYHPLSQSALIALIFSLVFFQAASIEAMAQSDVAPSIPTLNKMGPVLSAQQIQAAQSMTPAQIAAFQVKIQPTLANLQSQIASYQSAPVFSNWQNLLNGTATEGNSPNSSISSSTVNFVDDSGTVTVMPISGGLPNGGASTSAGSAQVPAAQPSPDSGLPPPCGPLPYMIRPCPIWGCGGDPVGCGDLDQDGLPDIFESEVADDFTPYYGPSAGEQQQFATFANSVPINITSLVGTVPPYSYFRVQPLGLATDGNNNLLFALRVDYLTLWNADGGLIGGGGVCAYSYVGLDQVIQERQWPLL